MSAKPTFFARRGIIIMMIVFFMIPFAMRGARMAIQGMKNDVKDWLPRGFAETTELEWFRKHFVSEQFVVASWEGCQGNADDERWKLFVKKLEPETPPSRLAKQKPALPAAAGGAEQPVVAEPAAAAQIAVATPAATTAEEAAAAKKAADEFKSPTRYFKREKFLGDQLGFYLTDNDHYDWGGQQEKWFRGKVKAEAGDRAEAWYYITPAGEIYRWDAVDQPLAILLRTIYRGLHGKSVQGELITSLGAVDGPWYYKDPRRLRALLFKSITTGPAVLESLTRPGGELAEEPEEAIRRLKGTLIGRDGKQTCIVLTLSDAAKQNLHLVLGRGMLGKPRGRLYELAEECNIAKGKTGEGLWLGGPPVDNVSIDEEGSITLVRLIGLCAVLGIGLSFLCFRTVSATIMVFFIGGVSAMMSMAFLWWFGSSVDAITMSMPALVYVLGLSGATHIINYYHEAVTEHGYPGACERAVAHSWKPALMCNITTAIGLVSLYTSELIPIQKFGVFAALGVMATLLVMFTFLPAALQIWPQKRREPVQAGGEGSWLEQRLNGFWETLGSFIIRRHAAVAIGCVLIITVFGAGVYYMKTSVNMLKMFHAQAKIIRDYTKLEEKLGPLVPMEIVFKIPQSSLLPPTETLLAHRQRLEQLEDLETGKRLTIADKKELGELRASIQEQQVQLNFLSRMELAARVGQVVEKEFGPQGRNLVGCAQCAATFVRTLPPQTGDTATQMTRGTMSARLEAHRDDFLHTDYLRIDQEDGAELWRLSLRIPATKGIDYGVFVEELKEAVEPVIHAQRDREEILRGLIAGQREKPRGAKSKKSDATELVRVSGCKVLLLGVPVTEKAVAVDASAQAPELGERIAGGPIDQTKIYTAALAELLRGARIKLSTHAPEKDAPPKDWAKLLAAQDCVVLAGDHSTYDIELIKKYARRFIDARGSRFDPKTALTAARQAPASIGAVYTGVVPIVYKAQRSLLDSLIQSTLWSFLTITPLMMFISRSFGAGAVAMLPNVLPVVMVFGGMGWLGIEVDVGSMMTASIALGVAVDDTIHYLTWFREELDRIGDRKKAILAAYKHCATPTFQAAIISGLGLSIFALSTFTPTQRFGYLMLAILWMGVAAELIFFPALLAGPLGVVFQPRKKPVAKGAGHSSTHTLRTDGAEAVGVTLQPALPLTTPQVASAETKPATSRTDAANSVIPAPNKATILRVLRHDKKHGE